MAHAAESLYFASADGLRLHCARYSARSRGGLPVLCLPGLTRNSRDFEALAQHLQAHHEVLALDLRGRGRSDRDPDPMHYQLPVYVRDALGLLDARAIARTVVIGTSLGALMGMVMAASAPQRIAGVVLNDAGPEFDPAGIRRITGYAGKLPPVTSWAQAAAQAREVYGQALPGLSDEDWLAYARRGYREGADGRPEPDVDPKIAEAFKAAPAGPANLWPVFALAHAVPMLVLRGELSDLLSAATVERMAREHPNLTAVTVPRRGHAPLLDEPECVAAIDGFLARCGHT